MDADLSHTVSAGPSELMDTSDLPLVANEVFPSLDLEITDVSASEAPTVAGRRNACLCVAAALALWPLWYGGLYWMQSPGWRFGAGLTALVASVMDAIAVTGSGLYFFLYGGIALRLMGGASLVCVGVNALLALVVLRRHIW